MQSELPIDLTSLTNTLKDLLNTPNPTGLTEGAIESDAEADWRAGGDVRIARIGPGVDASHNYERTHLDALTATVRLILAYLWS